MKQTKDFLGLSWIIFALCFLFNPTLHLIDPLPDFVGYIFLCLAFSKLVDLNEEIESAVSIFRKMIWVDAAKWLAIFITFTMSVTGEKNSSVLLWTFVFTTLELIFLLPTYTKLFDGISKLGYFYPNTSILGTMKKGKSATDRIKKVTIVFICIKSIFTVLPEFADLSNTSYQEDSGFVNIYRYIGLMRGFAILVVLIFGIVWLFRMQRYFYHFRHDKTLIASLSGAYKTNVQPKIGRFIQRRFKLSYLFLILALIFSMDYRLDGVTIFPDIFSAIAVVFIFLTLSRNIVITKAPWMIASGFYLMTSVVSFLLEQRFFINYSFTAIVKNDTAMLLYSAYVVCNLLKVLSFLWVVYLVTRALCQTIKTHTGTEIGRERIDERIISMEKELHKELRRPVFFAMISAVLYGISDICYDIFAPMLSGLYVDGEAIFGTFSNIQNHYGWLKTINIVLLAFCIGLFIRAMSLVLSAIEEKYMLE
ncbi:MAG: hypothetical protein J6Q82_00395 [Clostridia bacterium]|nr:hypothetical protein [Clostridia bacterium]